MPKKRYIPSAEREAKKLAAKIRYQKYISKLDKEGYERRLDAAADCMLKLRENESAYMANKRLSENAERNRISRKNMDETSKNEIRKIEAKRQRIKRGVERGVVPSKYRTMVSDTDSEPEFNEKEEEYKKVKKIVI